METEQLQKETPLEEFIEQCIVYNEARGLDMRGVQPCPIHIWSMEQHPSCHKNIPGVHYCPVCDQPMCSCGNHVVTVLSRTTGYISAAYTAGQPAWNQGKLDELKQRKRHNI